MPCDSSHMEANDSEIEAGRLNLVLDELAGHRRIDAVIWDRAGYDERVYCKSPDEATMDALTRAACTALQSRTDVHLLSLELQMWWRDHKSADAARLKREHLALKTAKARKAAIAKLTPYERKLLGL